VGKCGKKNRTSKWGGYKEGWKERREEIGGGDVVKIENMSYSKELSISLKSRSTITCTIDTPQEKGLLSDATHSSLTENRDPSRSLKELVEEE